MSGMHGECIVCGRSYYTGHMQGKKAMGMLPLMNTGCGILMFACDECAPNLPIVDDRPCVICGGMNFDYVWKDRLPEEPKCSKCAATMASLKSKERVKER